MKTIKRNEIETAILIEDDKDIKIVRYKTPEELLAAEYGMPIDELRLCKHGGFDSDGKEVEFDFNELIIAVKDMGCYGFAGNKLDIHVWISADANLVDVMNLLAHERGHLFRPFHRDLMKEEKKANLYGLCAEFACRVALNLGVNFNKVKN